MLRRVISHPTVKILSLIGIEWKRRDLEYLSYLRWFFQCCCSPNFYPQLKFVIIICTTSNCRLLIPTEDLQYVEERRLWVQILRDRGMKILDKYDLLKLHVDTVAETPDEIESFEKYLGKNTFDYYRDSKFRSINATS